MMNNLDVQLSLFHLLEGTDSTNDAGNTAMLTACHAARYHPV